MEFVALALEILGISLLPSGAENPGGSIRHGFLPIGDLHRMDVEFLGDLLNGFDALERFERYAGLEFWFVSSSFCFHFVWFRFGLMPTPGHHNHSLAPGPIFGVRLRQRVQTGRYNVSYSVSGAGVLEACGNGFHKDMVSFRNPEKGATYHGRSQVILRPNGQTGKITLTVNSTDFPPVTCVIPVAP